MLILAIDSATPVAGVALIEDEKLLCEKFLNYKKTHSETLMPMVDQVLQECEKKINDLDALAVTIGPGSFTGLRIGLAAVKGLSLATSIPVVTISTLEVLAHNLAYHKALLASLLDARKQEVYAAFYGGSGKYPQPLSEEFACSPEEFVIKAENIMEDQNYEQIILVGDGFWPYKEYFTEQFKDKLLIVPPHCMLPRAASLGSLAIKKVENKEFADIYTVRPTYIRLSEAEYRLGKGEL